MKTTFANTNVLVIDDFLAPQAFQAVSEYVSSRRYPGRIGLIGHKVAYGLQSHIHLTRQGRNRFPQFAEELERDTLIQGMPSGAPIDLVTDQLAALGEPLHTRVGRPDGDWLAFTRDVYRSGVGAGFAWHRDAKTYTGAYVFYASPTWDVDWGGELCVHARHVSEDLRDISRKDKLVRFEEGQYFFPRPNRIVVIRGGTPHCVRPVTDKASIKRHTVAGFFLTDRDITQRQQELQHLYTGKAVLRRRAAEMALRLLRN